jgi:hypothetical protein
VLDAWNASSSTNSCDLATLQRFGDPHQPLPVYLRMCAGCNAMSSLDGASLRADSNQPCVPFRPSPSFLLLGETDPAPRGDRAIRVSTATEFNGICRTVAFFVLGRVRIRLSRSTCGHVRPNCSPDLMPV